MKKIFLVKRKSEPDYDEFDSCVIIADSEEEVNYIIDNKREYYENSGNYINYWDNGSSDREVEEISLEASETRELCASFNAG